MYVLLWAISSYLLPHASSFSLRLAAIFCCLLREACSGTFISEDSMRIFRLSVRPSVFIRQFFRRFFRWFFRLPVCPSANPSVCPSFLEDGSAPIGVKLWENAIRMIWNISFFDAEHFFWQFVFKTLCRSIFVFKKLAFWRS